MRQSNKRFPYSGPHRHKDEAIENFLYSLKYHNDTTSVELNIGTKTLLVDFYTIGSKAGLNIAKVTQDHFCKRGIPVNFWYNNAQEQFMGSVNKVLCTYGLGSKQSESHKQNQNPSKCCIQEIKVTTRNVFDCSGTPRWSWILCMEYVVSILNYMTHHSLSWRTPREASYGFTPNVAHLMEF